MSKVEAQFPITSSLHRTLPCRFLTSLTANSICIILGIMFLIVESAIRFFARFTDLVFPKGNES